MARITAGPGHNSQSNLADPKDYRAGLALFVRMEEEKKAMNERHKRLKKRLIEGKGIPVEDVQRMFKMKDAPQSDMMSWLRRQAHALGAMFGFTIQADLFAKDPVAIEAIRFRGLMSGIEGKDGVPPPTLDGEEKKAWMNGWHDGIDSRKVVVAEMQKEFDEGDEGADHSEGAVQSRAAAAVGAQAAKDFREDNAPPMPDWAGMGGDHKKWKVSESAKFVAWFSSLPREADDLPLMPDGLPLGVRTAFIEYRDRMAGAKLDGGVKQGVGGDVVPLKPADVKRLDLTLDDFDLEEGEAMSAATYNGKANFDDYHLIVASHGDQRVILKDVVGPPPAEDEKDDFEAPAAELAAQKPREAVTAKHEVEAEPPKPAPAKAPRKPRESQSDKAARLAREAGVAK